MGAERADQFGEIAVDDFVELVERKSDSVVGDPVLRKVVCANLLGTLGCAHHCSAFGA